MPILGSRGGGAVKGFGLTSAGFGAPYDIDFLLIAGGGAGGNYPSNNVSRGGGGAGGYRTSYGTAPASGPSGGGGPAESLLSVRKGEILTITVGSGGSGAVAPAVSTSGNNSVIEGQALSAVTSIGGGRGHLFQETGAAPGGSGGGGFGAPVSEPAGLGTANQGFRGGEPTYNHVPNGYNSGGGGGAGGQGSDSSPSAGGNGVASSITGSSTTRAGGGGGGAYGQPPGPAGGGSGGSGGGGAGANGFPAQNALAGSGSVNTGSGGGGGSGVGPAPGGPGGSGGSGVIIIRLPTASYSGVTTGSPTVTTSGADTILTYTGTGTLKA
jgi:mucin-19